ncbi:MAG TPA: hypothetical protein VFV98_17585 [Vicinamibacterales bacterium]|nr:hypothetical protein [Vicinamibacterales bacterium]
MIAMLVASVLLIQPAQPPVPRLRPTSDVARDLVVEAMSRSPTIKRLVRDLEASDLFVYVELKYDIAEAPAETAFLVANNAGRFLRVAVDARFEPRRRIELLGHELRHALEIAQAPAVRDALGMRQLFNDIGWTLHRSLAFETGAAVDAERQVSRELARGRSET